PMATRIASYLIATFQLDACVRLFGLQRARHKHVHGADHNLDYPAGSASAGLTPGAAAFQSPLSPIPRRVRVSAALTVLFVAVRFSWLESDPSMPDITR